MEKKRGIYQGVSLPKSLLDEIENHLETHQEYKGKTEFIREAIREKISRDNTKGTGRLVQEDINLIANIVAGLLKYGVDKIKTKEDNEGSSNSHLSLSSA